MPYERHYVSISVTKDDRLLWEGMGSCDGIRVDLGPPGHNAGSFHVIEIEVGTRITIDITDPLLHPPGTISGQVHFVEQ